MTGSNRENADSSDSQVFGVSSNKIIVISLIAIAAMLIGSFLLSLASPQEKRIMAPGPIGSTDSISKPVG